MNRRSIMVSTLLTVVLGVGCSKQEQEEIAAIPAQSEVKAEQVEAQLLLQQVYSMQQAYYGANMKYGADLSTIGVAVPSSSRYRYSLTSTGASWSCKATANLDADPTVDTWVVDQAGGIACTTDDATS